MAIHTLSEKFSAMGARLKIDASRTSLTSPFAIDVRKDSRGEFFSLSLSQESKLDIQVVDLQADLKHLLLNVRQYRERMRPGRGSKSTITENVWKYLCGHDERFWFAAAIPEKAGATTVASAQEALKPLIVRNSQIRHRVRSRLKNKRRNPGFIRQGEWFFIPAPELVVDPLLVLKNEPLIRGRGKPHMAQYLYRMGGFTVYVCRKYPNGLTQTQYNAYVKEHGDEKLSWRVMKRDPQVYVKGKISHPDHKTADLKFWHQVAVNTEDQASSQRHLAFLD